MCFELIPNDFYHLITNTYYADRAVHAGMSAHQLSFVLDHDLRKFQLINIACGFGLFVHLFFIWLFYFINIPFMSMFNVLSSIMWAAALYVNQQRNHNLAIQIICIEIVLHAIMATYFVGIEFGFHYYLWPVACLAVVNPDLNSKFATTFGLQFIVLFGILHFLPDVHDVEHFFTPYQEQIYFFNVVFAGAPLIFAVSRIRTLFETQHLALSNLAIKDDLTKLYNRRYFNEVLANQISNLQRQAGDNCCLAIADIDHFKKVNDTLGHNKGDEVLSSVAHGLSKSLRKTDVLSRWGGEEFIILLPHLRVENAEKVLDKVRQAATKQALAKTGIDITLSVGVVQIEHNLDADKNIHLADELLYKAKLQGRNQVVSE